MGQSNQRLRENTYENLQNMMLERQDAESASNFGMGNTPGMSGENPMNSMIGEGGNTEGMGGTEMNPVDYSNNVNAILGDMSEDTGGMMPGMEMEEEGAEGLDMGPGRATRDTRRKMR
jgi:hypothetical protein